MENIPDHAFLGLTRLRVLRYLSIYLSIWLSIFLSIYLSICLSIFQSIYPSIYVSINLSINQSIYLSIFPSTYISVHLSINQSIYLSINQSIYLSIYLFYKSKFYISIDPLLIFYSNFQLFNFFYYLSYFTYYCINLFWFFHSDAFILFSRTEQTCSFLFLLFLWSRLYISSDNVRCAPNTIFIFRLESSTTTPLSLAPGSMSGIGSLEHLDISERELELLHPSALCSLPSLSSLKLEGGSFSSLENLGKFS